MHTEKAGALYVPPAAEAMTYDAYGILSSDGRWLYTWDPENRLSRMETRESARLAGVPHVRLLFTYDAMGRRITKKVFRADAQSGQVLVQRESWVFLYEGWNLIAEMDVNAAVPRLARSYEWGPAIDGVGGTGGLLLIRDHLVPAANGPPASQSYAPTYDGNGNITELVNLTTGQVDARYEYGPFGEALRVEGRAIAEKNPFRWATKYFDTESGLSYYGHRYYSADLGRWLSRDPIAESGGVNLYAMVGNDAVNQIDVLGLAACCRFGADEKGKCCNRCGFKTMNDGTKRCIVACTNKRNKGSLGSGGGLQGVPGGGGRGPCNDNEVNVAASGTRENPCPRGGMPPSNPTSNSRAQGCGGGSGDAGPKRGWAEDLYASMNNGDSSGFDGGKAEADEYAGEIGQGLLDTGKVMASAAAQLALGGVTGKAASVLKGLAGKAVSRMLGPTTNRWFYTSGAGSIAGELAKRIGGKTIDQTMIGIPLNWLTKKIGYGPLEKTWRALSKKWAEEAVGKVNFVCNKHISPKSVFAEIESKILTNKNPLVNHTLPLVP